MSTFIDPWADDQRPADPDELPEDVYRHTFKFDEDEPTYAEAINLDDYDVEGDR